MTAEDREQAGRAARDAVEAVRFEVVRPVRGRVLHPGEPASAAARPGDEHRLAGHFAAVVDHAIVGVASTCPAPVPPALEPELGSIEASPAGWWRLHGLAVAPEHRGRGLGLVLVERALDHAWRHEGRAVWARAAVTALGTWRRAGFEVVGPEREAPDHGRWVPVRLLR